MANEGSVRYTLEEQTKLMKRAEDLERENERRATIYQTQLSAIQDNVTKALQDDRAKMLGINIDIDKLSDADYVKTQIDYLERLLNSLDNEFKLEMTKVLNAYQGIEGQRGD